MKNILIGLLFGVLITLSFNGVTTTSTQTVKPAQPRAWVVDYGSAARMHKTMMTYSKQGYIVHKLEGTHYASEIFLVMYKYY